MNMLTLQKDTFNLTKLMKIELSDQETASRLKT